MSGVVRVGRGRGIDTNSVKVACWRKEVKRPKHSDRFQQSVRRNVECVREKEREMERLRRPGKEVCEEVRVQPIGGLD